MTELELLDRIIDLETDADDTSRRLEMLEDWIAARELADEGIPSTPPPPIVSPGYQYAPYLPPYPSGGQAPNYIL